jgi:8-oxo-dGTP pyrophosphatase MutT (NUDIX family)
MELKINLLQEKIQSQLPGIESHIEFYPYRFSNENTIDTSSFRKAAVAVHLFTKENQLHLLLIERSEYDGTHSKQIAFPGGKIDPDDFSTEYAARRESFEEVAIPFDKGQLIGQLTEVNIPVSKFNVIPFVFYHEELPELTKNEREVNEIFTISLEELLDESNKTQTLIQINKQVRLPKVPCFIIQEKIIWGATALILNELRLVYQQI